MGREGLRHVALILGTRPALALAVVAASVEQGDASGVVVEAASVELQEGHQQTAEVLVVATCTMSDLCESGHALTHL